jgi:hypothetical protein
MSLNQILDYFKWKFWTHKTKAMTKDAKVNIAVTYLILLPQSDIYEQG